jgi:hypothetical protein
MAETTERRAGPQSHSEGGRRAALMGLGALSIVLGAGAAMDLGEAARRKPVLEHAANAAIRRALFVARSALERGDPDWQDIAAARGKLNFAVHAVEADGQMETANIQLRLSGSRLEGALDYAVEQRTLVLWLFGRRSIMRAGSSIASLSVGDPQTPGPRAQSAAARPLAQRADWPAAGISGGPNAAQR